MFRRSDNATGGRGQNRSRLSPNSWVLQPDSFAVIRMTRPPTFHTVNLFHQNYQGKFMGQGLGPQRSNHITTPSEFLRVPICPPNYPADFGLVRSLPSIPFFPPFYRASAIPPGIQTDFPKTLGAYLYFFFRPRALFGMKKLQFLKSTNPFHVFRQCILGPASRPPYRADQVLHSRRLSNSSTL